MGAFKQSIKSHISPLSVIGVAAFSLVVGSAAGRYVVAEQTGHISDAVHAEATSSEPNQSKAAEGQQSPSESVPAGTAQSGGSSTITSTSSVDTNSGNVSGSVTVNGQTYTAPHSGELHQTTSDANGQTSVDISVQSSGSGQSYSSSFSNVNVSSSSVNVNQSTGGSQP